MAALTLEAIVDTGQWKSGAGVVKLTAAEFIYRGNRCVTDPRRCREKYRQKRSRLEQVGKEDGERVTLLRHYRG